MVHEQRIVEPQPLAVLVHVLGLDVHRQEQQHGVAAQTHRAEHRGERQQHDERGLRQPGGHVAAHA